MHFVFKYEAHCLYKRFICFMDIGAIFSRVAGNFLPRSAVAVQKRCLRRSNSNITGLRYQRRFQSLFTNKIQKIQKIRHKSPDFLGNI